MSAPRIFRVEVRRFDGPTTSVSLVTEEFTRLSWARSRFLKVCQEHIADPNAYVVLVRVTGPLSGTVLGSKSRGCSRVELDLNFFTGGGR